jgi:flagellar assembly protein FliH
MKMRTKIILKHPLREVRRMTHAPPQDWREQSRERERAAFERGKREGEKALGDQLLWQRTELAELQTGILNSLRRAVPDVIHETETAVLSLALESARKVVAGLAINPEMVEAVVREALRQVEDTAEVTVQLHPEDLALLRKNGSAMLNGVPESGPLRFSPSSEMTRGGCMVQTRFGLIDARRETKFEQLKGTLT